jgi:hypothetical protein
VARGNGRRVGKNYHNWYLLIKFSKSLENTSLSVKGFKIKELQSLQFISLSADRLESSRSEDIGS